jgi:hypothetical protein
MSIKQINASYLLAEDRILLRVSTNDEAEYRFWFTRRVTLFILQAAQQLLIRKLEGQHEKKTAEAIAEFDRMQTQAQLQSPADVKDLVTAQTNYLPGNHFPLGSDPLLVMDVRCNFFETFSIDLVLPGGANMNLNLPLTLLQMMCALLDRLGTEAKWGGVHQDPVTANAESNNQLETTVKQLH